ncbi:MAG: hypothetical protein K0S76_1158 [Herbinix sp.]|jgi:vacuolar-type H+-ATPase subunit H|nr:hypothetical protein [Herbinix sp.]
MEQTISQLFEIEKKANQIIDRASDEKTRLHDEREKDIKQMEESINISTSKKLKALQEKADADLANETKTIIQNCEKHLLDLEEINQKKYNLLVNQIFEHITRT